MLFSVKLKWQTAGCLRTLIAGILLTNESGKSFELFFSYQEKLQEIFGA